MPPHASILAVKLFLVPLKVWDQWYWLLLPLCLGVSIVYKSARIDSMRRLPLEALKTMVWIVSGMVAAAVALLLLMRSIYH
jgi:hypothetical protein